MVRVGLHGRRVRGWVVAVDVEPPLGVRLQPIVKVVGVGPAAEVVALADWAAWRWAGRSTALLTAASPPTIITALPAPAAAPTRVASQDDPFVAEALSARRAVLRLPPAHDPWSVLEALTWRGPTLVVSPSVGGATGLVRRLRGAGVAAVGVPAGWAQARAGGVTVVGARSAVWAPCAGLSAVVVLDAHDEALIEERAPTWAAWRVAAERADRAGVPCVLVSATPTLEQLGWGRLVRPPRVVERAGWAPVVVVDRRSDDPRAGLFSPRVVDLIRGASPQRPVLCVLNRKGRGRVLACASCRSVATCERCQAAVEQAQPGLRCRRCGTERPAVCVHCGAGKLRVLRAGVTKVREDLEALAGQPVAEFSPDAADVSDKVSVVVGTEAALHRRRGWAYVVFLDIDAELLAPRYRAAEQALVLLARAARLVGGRRGGGVVVLQTRQPDHPAIGAALRGDPDRFTGPEAQVRKELRLPPSTALALLSGAGADTFAADISGGAVEVAELESGQWLVRASDHQALCDALRATPRPAERLRIEVDPVRV